VRAVGASGVALGAIGTATAHDGTAADDVAETERVTGQRATDYTERALETVRQSDAYDGLRSQLEVRGYGLTGQSALVTENTDSGTVSVFLPLTGDGVESDLRSTDSELTGERLAHFVWTDEQPEAGHVIRTGPAEKVVPDDTDADRRLDTDGSLATEVITDSKHTVQYFKRVEAPAGADTVSDGKKEYAVCTVDVRQGSVSVERESDSDIGSFDNCPTSLPPILGYIITKNPHRESRPY